MTNLWYEIKKLGFIQIDKNCKLCQLSLKNFKKYPLTKNDAIVIVPDINCHGKIIHYHIGRIERCNIKKTKIYRDLEVNKNEME